MKTWDPKTLSIGALVLAVVLFLALNIFSSAAIRNVQVDLTDKGLYSLSEGTREVMASVNEPITLRYFLSRELLDASPGLNTYATRVRELVQRYVAMADGKIRLEIIDPKSFSQAEDRAVGFGLQGVPLNEAGELGYFGLAGTNTTDDQDVIGFFQPQREPFLEYDLTRLIYNLANPKKTVVGLISGLPIDADPLKKYKPWGVVEQMKQFFEVRGMGLDPKFEDDIDVLMIVHPIGLTDEALYKIDQFVLHGGKLIVFVDPFAEEGSRSNAAMRLPPDSGSDLNKLFKAWGVKYDRDKVLGDLGSAQRVSAGLDELGRPIITSYVAWLTMVRERLNTDDVIAADLQQINLASVGFLEKVKGADSTIEPLITSTKAAAALEARKIRFQPKPAEILKAFKSEDRSFVIAARISGRLKSAFPDGPPKKKDAKKDGAGDAKSADQDGAKADDAKGKKPGPPHLAVAKEKLNVIVVADTDILADNFWLQVQDFFGQQLTVPTANNGDFVINALDNLAGSSALIGLRSRGLSTRPFEKVQQIQKAAEVRYRDREQTLIKKLAEVQKKLKNLQTKEKADAGKAILTAKQKKAIADFRGEMLQVRREIRDVRRRLREDIDGLDASLKLVNIGAMPILVAVGAISIAMVRRKRTRQRYGGSLS